jgi:thiosulfate/3-mercaptopyruvate sulfurtransferase
MRALVLVLALAACARPAEAPTRVVQADELRAAPDDPARIVVDLRPAPAFATGHIPGAVNLDIAELRAEVDGVPEQVAPKDRAEATLTALGVDVGDEVIVVDDSTSPHAARLIWTLQFYGHDPAKLRVLDGGWPAWLAAGGPQTGEAGPPPLESQVVGDERPILRVDGEWVLTHLRDPTVLLLDVRTDDEWNAGHIPGATHLPWQRARTADGRLLDEPSLRALYRDALAAPTVAVYCKSGMRASFTWLVLHTLGHPDVRLYDGSWNEWGARPELPKET